jgi:thiol-disulfide isomerase/thioredoxin
MNREFVYCSRRSALRALVSIGLGLAALLTVLITFIVMHDHQDIRPILLVTYCVFFAAAFFSPRRVLSFNWIGTILVLLGGILPGLALRASALAFADGFYATLMAATAIAAALMGVTTRALVSRRRLALAGAVSLAMISLVFVGTFWVVPGLLDQRAYTEVDRPIAPFFVRSLEGEVIRSDTWRGRVVVVSYWATWCTPCLSEIPVISALQRKYEDDPRVVIVALNAGYGGDNAQKAREFLVRRHFDLATKIDDIKTEGHTKGDGAIRMGLIAVPTLFVLNKDQRLVAMHSGYDSSEHLATTLSGRIDALTNSIP